MDGEQMQPIKVEVSRLNIWHIIAVLVGAAGTLAVNSFFIGGQFTDIKRDIAAVQNRTNELSNQVSDEKMARIERGKQTDARFASIDSKLPQFDIIAQQILRLTEISTANQKQIEAVNDRFNRFNELNADKIDAITQKLNEVQADVRVVQSQLSDPMRNMPRRSELKIPAYPVR